MTYKAMNDTASAYFSKVTYAYATFAFSFML